MTETCTKCGEEPRAPGQRWGKVCRAEAKRVARTGNATGNGGEHGERSPRKPVIRGTAIVTVCGACAHRRQAVRAAFDLFVQGADKGLLARLAWVGFYDRVMEALE